MDFLFVIPEGWSKLAGEALDNLGVNVVIGILATQDYNGLTERMREFGVITPEQTVIEARLFDSEILAYRT
jgi:hypothetical protein